jgi:hypothetical protein
MSICVHPFSHDRLADKSRYPIVAHGSWVGRRLRADHDAMTVYQPLSTYIDLGNSTSTFIVYTAASEQDAFLQFRGADPLYDVQAPKKKTQTSIA